MLSIVLSTIAFFMARYYVVRYLDGIGIPKTLTRAIVAFCAALLVAYVVAYAVNWLVP
jgi:ABC-type Fe3+-siderophore transport system permease subunit